MIEAVGIETLHFAFDGTRRPAPFAPILVGVVGSGNLEVLVEAGADAVSTHCTVDVETSARGYASIWAAVLHDFQDRHRLAGVRVSISDMGATPAVVSLRLEQAVAQLGEATSGDASAVEASAIVGPAVAAPVTTAPLAAAPAAAAPPADPSMIDTSTGDGSAADTSPADATPPGTPR